MQSQQITMNQMTTIPPISFIFTSFERDSTSTDAIVRNLREFSRLASENGFYLTVQCETNNEETVRLTQSAAQFDVRNVIYEIETLIKIKTGTAEPPVQVTVEVPDTIPLPEPLKEPKVEVTVTMDPLPKEYPNEKLEELMAEQDAIEAAMKAKLMKRKIIVDNLSDELDNMKKKLKTDKESSFLEQKGFTLIKDSLILDKMCNRMSNWVAGDQKEPPFEDMHAIGQKRKHLIYYLDLLQEKLNKNRKIAFMQHKIREWLFCNWTQFLYRPSEVEKEAKMKEMKEKYQLENTIGTVHFLMFLYDGNPEMFCFAIVDKRIVCWSWESSRTKAISNLYSDTKSVTKWVENVKFSTKLNFKEKYSDLFVQCTNPEVYTENEKVIVWMQNNMNCLKYRLHYEYLRSIPSIYNFSFEAFEQSLR